MTNRQSDTQREVERFIHGQAQVDDDRKRSTKEEIALGMSESNQQERKEAKGR